MTCTDCNDRDTRQPPSAVLSIAFVVLVIGGIAVFASAPRTPLAPAAPNTVTEDWHGNVRASGWPND